MLTEEWHYIVQLCAVSVVKGVGASLFFLIENDILLSPLSAFFEASFLKLTSTGFSFIFNRNGGASSRTSMPRTEFYSDAWYMWR